MPLVYSLVPRPSHRPIYAVLPSSFDRLQYCKRSETGQWERILQVINNWTVGRPGNVLQAIKNLTVGRPGNEAILSNGYMIEIFW